MKHLISLSLVLLSSIQFTYSQFLIGTKASYDRYFVPGTNGASLNLFGEYIFKPHHRCSVRAGFSAGTPFHIEQKGIAFPSQDPNVSDFYDPFDQFGNLYTTVSYGGIFGEFLYFFRGDAHESNFYTLARIGVSYTSMKRRIEGVNEDVVMYDAKFDDDFQISVSAALGGGYQLVFGREKRSTLFFEASCGIPFLTIEGAEVFFYREDLPVLSLSGSIGYKFCITP